MSDARARLSTLVSDHPDQVILGFAVVVIFLLAITWLWARRASRLHRRLEEATQRSEALAALLPRATDLEHSQGRPVYSPADRTAHQTAAVPVAERPHAGREIYSVADRSARPEDAAAMVGAQGSRPAAADVNSWALTEAPPAAAAPPAPTSASGPASAPGTAPTPLWQPSPMPAEAAVPRAPSPPTPGVAWATTPERSSAPAAHLAPAPFREPQTVLPPEPPAMAPAPAAPLPSWSFGAAGGSVPQRATPPTPVAVTAPAPPRWAAPVLPATTGAGLEGAAAHSDEPAPIAADLYDAWTTLSRTPSAPPVAGAPHDNGAYAAWSEVTSRPPDPPPTVDLEGMDQVEVDAGGPEARDELAAGNGNGHAHLPASGNGSGSGHRSPAPDVPTEPGAVTPAPAPPATAPVAPLPARAGADHPEEVARTAALRPPGRPPGGQPATVLVPHTAAVTESGAPGGILIVEDDANVAKVYRLLLESKGHTVRVAADGVVAMDEVRRSRPELILLDVMMPRMNGILFLQSVRAQSELRDVPVVILSNFREPRLVDRAMSLGAVEYVVKAQTRPELLLAAIPRWMAGERAFSR